MMQDNQTFIRAGIRKNMDLRRAPVSAVSSGVSEILMANEEDNDGENDLGVGVISRTAPKTKRPSMYKVLLLNDDFTPQEFVVWLLETVFKKSGEDAVRIMLHVHQNDVGVCGVYTYEVAETKVAQVMELARRHQHPLQCTMEKE